MYMLFYLPGSLLELLLRPHLDRSMVNTNTKYTSRHCCTEINAALRLIVHYKPKVLL